MSMKDTRTRRKNTQTYTHKPIRHHKDPTPTLSDKRTCKHRFRTHAHRYGKSQRTIQERGKSYKKAATDRYRHTRNVRVSNMRTKTLTLNPRRPNTRTPTHTTKKPPIERTPPKTSWSEGKALRA